MGYSCELNGHIMGGRGGEKPTKREVSSRLNDPRCRIIALKVITPRFLTVPSSSRDLDIAEGSLEEALVNGHGAYSGKGSVGRPGPYCLSLANHVVLNTVRIESP